MFDAGRGYFVYRARWIFYTPVSATRDGSVLAVLRPSVCPPDHIRLDTLTAAANVLGLNLRIELVG